MQHKKDPLFSNTGKANFTATEISMVLLDIYKTLETSILQLHI